MASCICNKSLFEGKRCASKKVIESPTEPVPTQHYEPRTDGPAVESTTKKLKNHKHKPERFWLAGIGITVLVVLAGSILGAFVYKKKLWVKQADDEVKLDDQLQVNDLQNSTDADNDEL